MSSPLPASDMSPNAYARTRTPPLQLTPFFCRIPIRKLWLASDALSISATMCCSVLQLRCVAVYCSVSQCVAVCCNVLQCVAVHGRVLQNALSISATMCCSLLQCVAVCCSVLQCVAVCCSLLQCVAVCCRCVEHLRYYVLQCVAIVAVCCSEKSLMLLYVVQ